MRVLDQWVGSYRKAPLHPRTGALAQVDNPATWGRWRDILAWYAEREASIPRPYCPGFILKKGTGLVGLDFDHALDENGEPEPWAAPLLGSFIGHAYLERSPGGRGIRGFTLATLPASGRRSGGRVQLGGGAVEVYDDRRHLTVTGHVWKDSHLLSPGQAALDSLLDSVGMRARLTAPDAAGHGDIPTGAALADEVVKARQALRFIPSDITYPDWIAVLMALHSGLGEDGLALAVEWSRGYGGKARKFKQGEVQDKWRSFGARGGVSLGTLYHLAAEHGWEFVPPAPEEEFKPVEEDTDLPTPLPTPRKTTPPPAAGDDYGDLLDTPPTEDIPYHVVLVGHGKAAQELFVRGPDNLSLLFTLDPKWRGRFRWNVRRGPEIDGKLITDAVYTKLLGDATRHFGWQGPPATEHLYRAVEVAARHLEYDPIREYLSRLEWDRTSRISEWLVRAGAEDTKANRLMGARWLIGAAGRGLHEAQPGHEPLHEGQGTKFDSCLVIEGPQGVKKSWLFSAICPVAGYFFDSTFDFRAQSTLKDLYQHLHGNFILEMAELDALAKASEVSTVKAVITSRHDDFRAPYGRAPERHARRSVLVGTCNEAEYLRDTTGNRRFWPVPIAQVNVDWVRANRDQLWAEAVVAYRAGDVFWEDAALAPLLDALHRERIRLPAWSEEVAAWLDNWPHRVFRLGNIVADLPHLRHVSGAVIGGVLTHLRAKRIRLRLEGREQNPVRWYATPKATFKSPADLADDARKVISLDRTLDVSKSS
jgi:hypothetical protein